MFDLDIIDQPVDLASGEWVGDIPGHPGVRFLVRSKNYKPFDSAHSQLLQSYGKKAKKELAGDDYRKRSGALMSEHLLLDWDSAMTKGGKPVPYDRKIADKVLTSVDERGAGQAFRDAVSYAANVVYERNLGIAEDVAGN